MARPKNRVPKEGNEKLYRVWCKVRHHHLLWSDFSDFADSVGFPPSPTHTFKRRDEAIEFGPRNYIWLAQGQRLPLGAKAWPTDTKLALVPRENAYINNLIFGTYFGDGLWHAVCTACKTPQVVYPEGHATCPVCEAARRLEEPAEEPAEHENVSELLQGKDLRQRRAKTAKAYYAFNQLKRVSRHGTQQDYDLYLQNLPTSKAEREDYVLEQWAKLKHRKLK